MQDGEWLLFYSSRHAEPSPTVIRNLMPVVILNLFQDNKLP